MGSRAAIPPEGPWCHGQLAARALLWLLPLAALLSGCASTIYPPPRPADPVTVLVADYGRHTSLLLPDPAGGYWEYAYGDWNFFAVNKDKWYNAAQALFASPAAAFGRRHLDIRPQQPDLLRTITAKRVLYLHVPRDKAMMLETQLDQRFNHDDQEKVYNPLNHLMFVRDEEHYSLVNNCNPMTARWLQELGCRIRGPALTSNFHLAR